MVVNALWDYIDSLPIVSTHEHHKPFPPCEKGSLEFLFANSYVAWCGVDCIAVSDRARFLDLVSGNSYFVWYEKALNELFDLGGRITVRNWDETSERIRAVFSDVGFHERVFRKRCGFKRAIQDSQWEPGSDNGRPDLYAPAFRINSFLIAYHPDARDHNGNNAQVLYGKCGDADEYLSMLEKVIEEMKAKGCVCLKLAVDAGHPLSFNGGIKHIADRIFGKPPEEVGQTDARAFADYVFEQICVIAARYNMPLQCHTGLGTPGTSHPLNLIQAIERHRDTRFVILHGGYPWTSEVAALTHSYENVYVDMSVLPLVCNSTAVKHLHSLLEAARDASRITWGGDCCYVTESYGAAMAMRHVLKVVLSEKIASGYLTKQRACRLAERILAVNAEELYDLPRAKYTSKYHERFSRPSSFEFG